MLMRVAFVFLTFMVGSLPPTAVRADRPAVARSIPNGDDFARSYRISHYLGLAAEFQTLALRDRADRLRAMAKDPSRFPDIFPLCRMLFEANAGGVFRRPLIGRASFLAGTYQDWPLEPIALFEDIPILIVRGYSLGGKPESATQYVAYCLANCRRSDRKYTVPTTDRLRQTIDRFIASKPALRPHADWLRLQAA